jgi:hypothetical protein
MMLGDRGNEMTKETLFSLVLFSTPLLAQTTHSVNLDDSAGFTEIQSAIDVAADGDVALVAPGEYVITEPIDFDRLHDPHDPESPPLKNLLLRWEGGADETIIRMSENPVDAFKKVCHKWPSKFLIG